MLDFINDNSGLVAILGVIIGWALSVLSGHFSYRRQKNDDFEKERRDRFLHKAELNRNDWYKSDLDNTRRLEIVLCVYEAYLDNNNTIVFKFPNSMTSLEKLDKKYCVFENTGESDINDLEVGVMNSYRSSIFPKDSFTEKVKNGYISYSAYLDGRIRRGEALELVVYYSEDDLKNAGLELSVEAYFRDSRNNYCTQILPLANDGRTSEPVSVTREEWRERVGIENNISYWLERLKH